MNNSGDAAEQVVRLSLEGFEVAAKLTGTAAKELTVLLVSVLKQEHKTKGKARLTNMLKSGKELKVFSIQQKDLKKFTEQAKKYGVLYCVLKDKHNKNGNATVDIIARAEDASKIQRIFERFELGKVDKASIVAESEKSLNEKEEVAKEVPEKTKGQKIADEALNKPIQKDGDNTKNPQLAKTDKNPQSRQNSDEAERTDKGKEDSKMKKPSVKEKLSRYKNESKQKKEAERAKPEQEKKSKKEKQQQTKHKQPKKKKKDKSKKER